MTFTTIKKKKDIKKFYCAGEEPEVVHWISPRIELGSPHSHSKDPLDFLILSNLMFHHGPSHGFLRANDNSNSTNNNGNSNLCQHFLGTPVAGE